MELRSWAFDDIKRNGYIRINGEMAANLTFEIYDEHSRGFNIVELNSSDCSTYAVRHFDTYEHVRESSKLLEYLATLPANTTVLGATADEASRKLTMSVRRALLNMGVNVDFMGFRWKLVFVATTGRIETTVYNLTANGGRNLQLFYSTALNAVVSGECSPCTLPGHLAFVANEKPTFEVYHYLTEPIDDCPK